MDARPPATPASATSTATPRTPVPAPGKPARTILIVESLAIYREPLEAVLRAEGYATFSAADGPAALAILTRHKPDLILLDLALPGISGVAILTQLRALERFRATPVIVLTALTDRDRILDARRLGVAAYILKSKFSLAQLLDRIREQLNPAARPAPPAAPGATGLPPAGPSTPPAAASASPLPSTVTTDPVAALKTLKPLVSRTDILDRIARCAELKAFSPTVAHILSVTGGANTSVEVVSKAISQDHAIALKILKLANSTVYTRGDPIDSVHKAVVRIGLAQIRQAVLNISVVEKFTSGDLDKYIDTAQFWEHSIACGLIAAEIAHATDPGAADGAFTMGLIHDAGRVIFAQELRAEYVTVLQTARRLQLPLEQVEARMLLFNHADVMDRILHLWNFPKNLISPVVYHHLSPGNVRSVAPHQLTEVLRLGLANRLAHAFLLGCSGNDTIYPTGELFAALKLDAGIMQKIEADAARQTAAVKISMLSHASTRAWPERRTQAAAEIGAPFRPLFIGAEPAIDAYRILCDQLRTAEGGPAPNIAVVHLDAPRARIPLSARLLEAEESAGVKDLPLIILSPVAKLTLDDATTARRRVQNLSSPVALTRFLEAARALLAPAAQAAAAA